jgi:hypothetical protein
MVPQRGRPRAPVVTAETAPSSPPEGGSHARHPALRRVARGFFYDAREDEGSTRLYRFGDRTLGGSSFALTRNDGTVGTAADVVASLGPAPADAIRFEREHLAGFATVERQPDDEDGANWLMSGRMAAPGGMCLVTIAFRSESDTAWALETWRSLDLPMGASAGPARPPTRSACTP